MQLPTIHPNGTPKQSLVDALCVASEALDAAYQGLKQCAPNGRDHSPDGLELARTEHMDRLRRVDAVKSEIDALTVAITAMEG